MTWKEEKEKIVEDKNKEKIVLIKKGIGTALTTRQSHTIDH